VEWVGSNGMHKRILYRRGGVGFIAAAIALGVSGAIALLSKPNPQPEIECYTEQTPLMTIQQVADLLDIPLVELTWLPNNLHINPVIRTVPSYSYRPYCQVDIEYLKPNSVKRDVLVAVRISQFGAIQPTKAPTSCAHHFSPDGPIRTDCWIEVDGIASTLRVSFNLSSEVPPETALNVLDGIQVIEPQE
jgi:hypothetical protein